MHYDSNLKLKARDAHQETDKLSGEAQGEEAFSNFGRQRVPAPLFPVSRWRGHQEPGDVVSPVNPFTPIRPHLVDHLCHFSQSSPRHHNVQKQSHDRPFYP